MQCTRINSKNVYNNEKSYPCGSELLTRHNIYSVERISNYHRNIQMERYTDIMGILYFGFLFYGSQTDKEAWELLTNDLLHLLCFISLNLHEHFWEISNNEKERNYDTNQPVWGGVIFPRKFLWTKHFNIKKKPRDLKLIKGIRIPWIHWSWESELHSL